MIDYRKLSCHIFFLLYTVPAIMIPCSMARIKCVSSRSRIFGYHHSTKSIYVIPKYKMKTCIYHYSFFGAHTMRICRYFHLLQLSVQHVAVPHTTHTGSSASTQPRLIHELDNVVLLISAIYTCENGHRLLTHDHSALKQFPSKCLIPFVFHVLLSLNSFSIHAISCADVD